MIKVSSIKYNNELRPTQDLPFLMGCIGEKVNVKVAFYYEDVTFCSADNAIALNPSNATVNLASSDGVIVSENVGTFKDYYVGDNIGMYVGGVFLYYVVLEKFGNTTIRTSAPAGATVNFVGGEYIFNCTPFNGIRYAYNLIESGNSYLSLVDGEYQELIRDGKACNDTSSSSMAFTGLKSYQIGSATIKGVGGSGAAGAVSGQFVQQRFEITHETVITPFFLVDQYADLLARVKPSYFTANKCLNYISQIQLNRNLNNPNGIQTLQVPNTISNVGWWNEKLNGGQSNYSISSLVLKKGATIITNGLEFGTDITVEMLIDNTADAPFSSGNTKYIFGFNFVPESDALIKNNGYDQTRNFLFDSKLNTLGSGSANGANFGTPMQVIKSVTSTFVSTSQMKVTATINVGGQAKEILQQGSFSRYAIWLVTENHSLPAVNSDKVNLLASVSEFYVQKINPDLISSDGVKFIPHPGTTIADGINPEDVDLFPVDDVVAVFPFSINYADDPGVEPIAGVRAGAVGFLGDPGFTPVTFFVVDNINDKVIGVADYAGTIAATVDLLILSINTNTSYGTIPSGFPAFSNASGWTCSAKTTSAGYHSFTLSAPIGAIYNGYSATGYGYSGATQVQIFTTNFIGGIDYAAAVPPKPSNKGSKIKSIQSKFVLRDDTAVEADIVLEDFTIQTLAYPVIGGKAQNIAFAQDRVYRIPQEIRKTILAERDFASDTTNVKYFNYWYPFMERWEYWRSQDIQSPPAGIFDNSQPLNGLNKFWYRFTNIATWHMWYDVVFTLEQNGVEFKQTFSSKIKDSNDFEGNPEWVGNSIKSYDIVTNTELDFAGEKFIKGYEDVKVVASFVKTSGYVPSADEFGIVIWIHVFEENGDNTIRRISSEHVLDSQSWFKSTDTSDLVTLNKTGNIYTGTCLLDYSKIPTSAKYTIYARLYEVLPNNTKQFMDATLFQFMDGSLYEFM